MATTDNQPPRPVVLPQPQRVILRNFSLYRRRQTVEVAFDRDVFCLAGANGLGKSTFLAALSYAITGAVSRPGLTFLGASDYYDDLLEYSAQYFDGRISADDRLIAEVELELAVGEWQIRLVRGMFDPQALRQLHITSPEGSIDLSGADLTDRQRHQHYVDAMCRATGLSDFAQLVFLQLVVLTFDEQRRLMFWTPRVAEQALFLAFGVSAEVASRAEALQRTYDSAESQARNLQWQATGRRKRLKALEETVDIGSRIGDERDLRGDHERLTRALDEAGAELNEAGAACDAAEVTLNDVSARLLEAKNAYEQIYDERIGASRSAHLHPVVNDAVVNESCDVCGTTGERVVAVVRGALDDHRCPLCDSTLPEIDAAELADTKERLLHLGVRMVELEEAEKTARSELLRRQETVASVERRVLEISRELEEFRKANNQALLRASGEDGVIEEATRSLREEMNDLLTQKDLALTRRDAAQRGLDALRDELTARFADMEHEFVPLLHELANEFLGVPLQVDLQRRGSKLDLTLSFAGTERRRPEALSESQRFFMDIALRMALARKLTSPGQPATLYVDTPEGSLDIAYEMRAGRMFARFARGDDEGANRLIMTANINTSQLLQQMALSCGDERMELVRMTEWTELSDVQLEAVDDFEKAYSTIERRLGGDRS